MGNIVFHDIIQYQNLPVNQIYKNIECTCYLVLETFKNTDLELSFARSILWSQAFYIFLAFLGHC
jgi:hypothetical protein